MKLSPKQRGALLVLALAATLVLSFGWEPPRSGEEGVAEASVPKRRQAQAAGGPELDLERLTRERAGGAGAGGALFGAHSWAPPPAAAGAGAAARAGPPPKPKAPPLPFTYIGKLVDGGKVTVFLAQGERNHVVSTGAVIDDRYRVDRISDAEITLTYLPLKEQQKLPIGGAE